jgi:acetyl esterase
MTDRSDYDVEVAAELERFPPPDVPLADVAATRAAYNAYFQAVRSRSATPPAVGVRTEEHSVPSLVDGHQIPVRVYRPDAPEQCGGLVYVHGGSFVFGDLELEDARCRALAHDAGCVVVSVDYRLAPEHPFPTPLEDCHAALQWVFDHAEQLSVDPRCVGVGGCSAGGALAAGLAIRCRDQGGPAPAFQLLLNPVLDAAHSSDSMRTFSSADELRDAEQMWEHYLGGPRTGAPAHASPASCDRLEGLAPAYIDVAEYDALRDEAIAYAQRLLSAGVSVELHVWPRIPHAVELFTPDVDVSRQLLRAQGHALGRLARTATEARSADARD